QVGGALVAASPPATGSAVMPSSVAPSSRVTTATCFASGDHTGSDGLAERAAIRWGEPPSAPATKTAHFLGEGSQRTKASRFPPGENDTGESTPARIMRGDPPRIGTR